MTKRKIFDIEKIGFGDEEIISPDPKPVLKNEPFVQPTVKPRVQPVVNRPPAILSNEVTIKQEKHYSEPIKRQPSRVSAPSPTANSGYKPVEFVSPISGRRVNQPKTVHLAHGQYYFATASMVDEKMDKLKDEESQLEKKLVDEEGCTLHSNNQNEGIKLEDEVCPSFTTANDARELQQDETTTVPILSDESEDIHVVAIDESIHEEVDVHENGECITSDKEEVKIPTSDHTEADLESALNHSSEDSSLEVKDLSHSAYPASLSSQKELDMDGVLSLLDEEEKSPSIFDSLLEESTQSQTLNQEHGLEDVMNLLEEEENQASIFDQILNQSEQTDTTEVDVFIEEAFDDENFCNEVLEQVQTESAEVEAVYYEMPPLNLLKDSLNSEQLDEEWIVSKMEILEQTFHNFGVKVRLTGEYTQGPTVTQIEIQPESGTKLNKIMNLSDDLKLSLSVEELRIEPISGKNTIGVEIPNPKRKMVYLKEILSKHDFMFHESPLYIGLGQDVAGQPVYADILTMPHGLIAGQTGSGKSVCINSLLVSVLYKASPEDVRLMLIDPKRVELAPYNSIPHLITPVICDERKAAQGLKWAVEEMERRYELFATNGVRDIKSFNERRHEFEMSHAKLPYLLIVIDELADLMMVSAQEVEDCIMRITQKARAAGIHLIVATQRPTVDVITGTIKSNIPSRMAFAVAQANDSRVILDETGAQTLLGQGDMLWSSSGSKVKRVQGAYISSDEIDKVVDYVKQQGKPKYLISDEIFQKGSVSIQSDTDPLLYEAMNFIFDRGHATVSSLQTRLRIGFNRAARIIDTLELNGWIGEPQGAQKQREIKISREEFEAMKDQTRF